MIKRELPYQVIAYRACIATFNSLEDAKLYAMMQSVRFPNSWKEVRITNGELLFAYANSNIVYD